MKKGFTLLEMLMVLVIIGILVWVSVPQYKIAVMGTRYNRGRQTAEEIYLAEQAYYMAHGKLTALLEQLNVSYPVKQAVYYTPEGESPTNDVPDDLLGINYMLENGDELLINKSGFLFVSYTPKGMHASYRLNYVPQAEMVTRECGVTSRGTDPAAYEEGAAVCRALGAQEEPRPGEDALHGSYFSW